MEQLGELQHLVLTFLLMAAALEEAVKAVAVEEAVALEHQAQLEAGMVALWPQQSAALLLRRHPLLPVPMQHLLQILL